MNIWLVIKISFLSERIFIFTLQIKLFLANIPCFVYIHHVTFFKLISLSMAQFSPVEWMLRRNCLILPTSCPIVPSATPKLSKPPTMKNPSFNCGSFDNVTAFLGSSSKTSQVVLINLSLGCSALPDTNLNVERRMGGWNNMKYLVQYHSTVLYLETDLPQSWK